MTCEAMYDYWVSHVSDTAHWPKRSHMGVACAELMPCNREGC